MSDSHFCGIPCGAPNAWEVQQSAPGLSLNVHGLQFCADFYNAHHACCWPRLLLDTHLGRAAAEVQAASTSCAAAERVAGYAEHVATVAEQLFAAQQAPLPRAPSARRVQFHDSVPPVLRYHTHGDAFVYVLRGQLRLRHRCPMPHSTPLTPQRQPATHEAVNACTHGAAADALARDVFPLALVMAPSETCAMHVDADPPTASAATTWRAKPLVLALESVTRESPATTATHAGGATFDVEGESGTGAAVWCAAYTPFSWTCHPAGNQRRAGSPTSTAMSQRAARSSAPRGGTSKGRRGKRQTEMPSDAAARALAPLRLSFAVYASRYTSASARWRVLNVIEDGGTYSLHVTKRMRFSLAAPEVHARAVLGAEKEALRHARSRRTSQLMRLFDHTARVPKHSATSEHNKRPRSEDAIEGSSPAFPGADAPTRRAVPLVTTTLVGQLGVVHAIPCEWCPLPRATTLASVLPLRAASRAAAGASAARDGEGPPSAWSVRVQAPLADASGPAVELSSLDTLQRLSAALRSVTDSSSRLA